MGIASYKIVPNEDGWGVDHDGRVVGSYATKEAAFEAAVAPASNAIKQGHEVRIVVASSDTDAPALGTVE
jgi:hypothetical protein